MPSGPVLQYCNTKEESRFYSAEEIYRQIEKRERSVRRFRKEAERFAFRNNVICKLERLRFSEEFDNYMQQDAHEFLNFLINHINEIILGEQSRFISSVSVSYEFYF